MRNFPINFDWQPLISLSRFSKLAGIVGNSRLPPRQFFTDVISWAVIVLAGASPPRPYP